MQINIDDKKLEDAIIKTLSETVVHSWTYETETRQAIAEAVKDVVYKNKNDIIEKCVKRATTELVKKGLPKLMSELTDFKN